VSKKSYQVRYWFRNRTRQLAAVYLDSRKNSAIPIVDTYLQLGQHYRITDPAVNAIALVGQDPDFYAFKLEQNYTIEKVSQTECD
jgi:hypothetical protein